MSEVSPEIIAKTQKSLGKYVKKPALSEKLLKKPPFRFLHDVIKVVIKDTGFLSGLFSEDELNSDNVKEKEAKVAFLTKLIDAVKAVSKTDLKVRSSKIVAGLEPTETNILLQTIATSIDKKIDTTEYVAAVNSGNLILKEKSRRKSTEGSKDKKEKEKKTNSKESARKESKTRDSSVSRLKKSGSVETPKSTERVRESSRSKLKEEKKEKSSSKSKQKTETSSRREKDEKKDRVKEKKAEIRETENELQKVSKENEKVIDNRVETNNISNKTIQNNKAESAERADINTGEILLQEESKADKTGAKEKQLIAEDVQSKQSQNNATTEDVNTTGFSNARQSSAGLVRPKSARPKSGDRLASSRGRGGVQETEGKHDEETGKKENELKGPIEMKAATTPAVVQRPPSSLRPPSVRPSSARPGAPRLRPDSALPASENVVMGNINVIVENFDSGLGDEEETVVIQNAPEITEENDMTATDLLNISAEGKGQLVEQILDQIKEHEEEIKKKVEIDWEQDSLRGKDATTKEVTQLRSYIQSLTKTANPLGKLMNYLHEDLDAMHSELQMWTNTKRQLYTEIEKQKRLTTEANKPLLEKLDHLRQEVKKQEQEILSMRSNIISNEQRIAELLGKEL